MERAEPTGSPPLWFYVLGSLFFLALFPALYTGSLMLGFSVMFCLYGITVLSALWSDVEAKAVIHGAVFLVLGLGLGGNLMVAHYIPQYRAWEVVQALSAAEGEATMSLTFKDGTRLEVASEDVGRAFRAAHWNRQAYKNTPWRSTEVITLAVNFRGQEHQFFLGYVNDTPERVEGDGPARTGCSEGVVLASAGSRRGYDDFFEAPGLWPMLKKHGVGVQGRQTDRGYQWSLTKPD